MRRTIKAKFSNGMIEPLEKLDLDEGEEITVTIMEVAKPSSGKNGFERSAGGWKGTVDADKLIRNIYADRLISTRKAARL